MYACSGGDAQCELLLIERGADVQRKSDDGMTVTHYAVLGGNNDVLLAVLNAGAEVDSPDDAMMTPSITTSIIHVSILSPAHHISIFLV